MSNTKKDNEKILSQDFLDEIKIVREQRGISIEEVAEKTNIKTEYIRAIEQGDLSKLPGGPYNKAFIKSVSEFLGISTKPFENKVEAEQQVKEKEVKVMIGRVEDENSPNKLIIIGCLLLILVLYTVLYGPKVSKEKALEDNFVDYQEQINEAAEAKIDIAKTENEIEEIRAELNKKIEDKASFRNKLLDVSPLEKDTSEYINKELVITLLALGKVKVLVKNSRNEAILDKEMENGEAQMLNGYGAYYLAATEINNLEIYLDGVLVKDISKFRKNGNMYVLEARGLINSVENETSEKDQILQISPDKIKE